MPIRSQHIIDQRLDDSPQSTNASWDFGRTAPRKVSLYVVAVETLTAENLTITVELSPDEGTTLVTYDKLLTDAGTDAPAASVVYTGTADDVISISLEDVVRYIRVTADATGANTTVTEFWEVDIWLVWEY